MVAGALLLPAAGWAQATLTWGGGSGTWDTTTANWTDGSTATTWMDGDAAVFSGAGGTISLPAPVTVSQLTFSAPGYSIENLVLRGAVSGLTVEADSDAEIDSAISGAVTDSTAFTKTGAGTLTLTGVSTYAGTTEVVAGELVLSGSGSINGSAITVSGGTLLVDNTVFQYDRISEAVNFTMNGGAFVYQGNASSPTYEGIGKLVVGGGGSSVTVTNPGTGTTQVAFAGMSRAKGMGTVDFSGNGTTMLVGVSNTNGIVGPYATVNQSDWAAVNGTHNVTAYAGYVTSLSSAQATDNVVLTGNASATPGPLSINSLNIRGSASHVTVGTPAGVAGDKLDIVSGGLLVSGTGGVEMDGGGITSSSGELVVIDYNFLRLMGISDSAVAVTLTKSGTGTLSLYETNRYTGDTNVQQGTLQLEATGSLTGGGALTVAQGATFSLNGNTTQFKSLSGAGAIVFNNGTILSIFGGTTTFSGAITGAGTLLKNGPGTLTLSGANDFSALNIGSGTVALRQQEAPVLASDTDVLLAGGGTLALFAFRPLQLQQLGTLKLSGAGVLDFGSLANGLAFADSSGIAWSGQLSIANWIDGDTLRFGTSASGLTSGQLAEINFNGVAAQIDANGYISAVPEPGTLVLVGVGGALLWRVRRRLVRA